MKPLFLATLLVLPALTSHAAPDAGSLLQQVKPPTGLTPAQADTGLSVKSADGGATPQSAPFLVRAFKITGNKKISTEVLHALVADAEGKNLTLVELDKVISRISDYYTSHGYPLARAIIPAQTVQAGIVNIQIIVARYGKVVLENRSQVKESVLQATLSSLQSGNDIEQAGLDRTLLLLTDMPGVGVKASLKPGQIVGTSDISISALPTPRVTGNVALDGHGNSATGRVRVGATVNINDPLDLKSSDMLTLSALTSGSGVSYGRIGYEAVLNGQGTRVGGSLSALDYAVNSDAFEDTNGTARVQTLWVKHPFIRTRDLNLYGQIQYDGQELRDHASVVDTDRSVKNMTMSLSGDSRDEALSGGVNSWNAGWTAGKVDFSNVAAKASDLSGANTQGSFSKWNANLARLQRLSPKNSLYASFSGQWANKNLDSSQKMTVGGPSSVRAYEAGAVSGDEGYLLSAELRHDFDSAWQAVAFVDHSSVTNNKTPLPGSTSSNSEVLSGAGLGLNWIGPNQWTAKASIAKPIGATTTQLQDNSSRPVRAWLEARKAF
jgi:hemolysin activation/secretion protein